MGVNVSDFQNPWLAGAGNTDHAPAQAAAPVRESWRPTTPQSGVPAPDSVDRLPQRTVDRTTAVWWLGVHGGAGETTLSRLFAGSQPAGHSWPIPPDSSTSQVVLVARTNASGLAAAQRAATEWASGTVPHIAVLGLVFVADAPGKLPKPLRDLRQVVSGGVPAVWHFPWVEAWRLGELVSAGSSPSEVQKLVAEISGLIQFPNA